MKPGRFNDGRGMGWMRDIEDDDQALARDYRGYHLVTVDVGTGPERERSRHHFMRGMADVVNQTSAQPLQPIVMPNGDVVPDVRMARGFEYRTDRLTGPVTPATLYSSTWSGYYSSIVSAQTDSRDRTSDRFYVRDTFSDMDGERSRSLHELDGQLRHYSDYFYGDVDSNWNNTTGATRRHDNAWADTDDHYCTRRLFTDINDRFAEGLVSREIAIRPTSATPVTGCPLAGNEILSVNDTFYDNEAGTTGIENPYTRQTAVPAPTEGLPTRTATQYNNVSGTGSGLYDAGTIDAGTGIEWRWIDTAYEPTGTWRRPVSSTNERRITTTMSYTSFSGAQPSGVAGNHNTAAMTVNAPGDTGDANTANDTFTTITDFDLHGHPTLVTDPNGRLTSTCFDPLKRLIGVWNNDNQLAGDCTANVEGASQRYDYIVELSANYEDFFNDRPTIPEDTSIKVPNWSVESRTLHSRNGVDAWHRPFFEGFPVADDVFIVSVDLIDGLGRVRESGRLSPGGIKAGDTNNDGVLDWMVTHNEWDTSGRAIASTEPARHPNNTSGTTAVPWAPERDTFYTPILRTNVTNYDDIGRPTRADLTNTDANDVTTIIRSQTTSYSGYTTTDDPWINKFKTSPYGSVDTTTDVYGNTVEVTDDVGGTNEATTRYGYNLRGEQEATRQPLDGTVSVDTIVERNLVGWPIATDDPNAGYSTSDFYATGETRTTVDAENNIISTAIDDQGRTTNTALGTNPNATGQFLEDYTYDGANELGALTQAMHYTRSGGTQTLVSDTDVTGFDTMGRRTDWTVHVPIADTATTSNDDELGDVYAYAETFTRSGQRHTFTHPATGALAPETVTTGYTTLGYDSDVTSTLTDDANHYVSRIIFDDIGRVLTTHHGTVADPPTVDEPRLARSNQYSDIDGRLGQQTAQIQGGAGIPNGHVQWDAYGYDASGNIINQKDWSSIPWDGSGRETLCYYYDSRQRLIDAFALDNPPAASSSCPKTTPIDPAEGGPAPYDLDYTYDQGNRATEFANRTMTHNPTIAGCDPETNPTKPHAVATAGAGGGQPAETFTYDCNGSQLTTAAAGVTTSYTWSERNRLETVTIGTDNPSQNLYDHTGQRVVRNDPNGDTTVYLPDSTLVYNNATGDVDATRTYQGGSQRNTDNTITHTALNHHNSIVATFEVTSGTYTRTRYRPYGDIRQGPTLNDHGHLNQINDPNQDLNYLNNRHYNPTTGVFLSVDPLVALTGEPYIYGAANPVTYSDPDGLCASIGSNCPDGIPVIQNGEPDHRAWRWTRLQEAFPNSPSRVRELYELDRPTGPLPASGLPGRPKRTTVVQERSAADDARSIAEIVSAFPELTRREMCTCALTAQREAALVLSVSTAGSASPLPSWVHLGCGGLAVAGALSGLRPGERVRSLLIPMS